jgi:hypothetical protein
MRKPRTDVCIFDKFIRRSCGHEQRYVCRLKNEQTRERRVAELMGTPCRACELLQDMHKLGYRDVRPELGHLVSEQPLHLLRLFVLAVLARMEQTEKEYDFKTDLQVANDFNTAVQGLAQLFRSDKPAKSDTPR